MLLVLFVSVCAQAQTHTLAVYAGSASGLHPESKSAMKAEVQRLLSPATLEVIWKNTAEKRAGEDFEFVAVASFEGSCAVSQAVPAVATVSLADTSVSDGRILPFFTIDCTRVIQMLGPHVEPTVLGRALGRIIAHELYHIVARTSDHHDTGVAKAAFSIRDLTNSRFEFDAWSLSRMNPAPMARPSESPEAAGR